MSGKFEHYDLQLVEPAFDSALTDLIIDLDYLRRNNRLRGSTPPRVFFQLKHIFHTLESIGSARIEGNHTTIAEYIETKLDSKQNVSSGIQEIRNIEKTMEFIEDNVKDISINRMFISEIHKRVVDGLLPSPHGEGDFTPGKYRNSNVIIGQSAHTPPESLRIDEYMDELFDFMGLC